MRAATPERTPEEVREYGRVLGAAMTTALGALFQAMDPADAGRMYYGLQRRGHFGVRLDVTDTLTADSLILATPDGDAQLLAAIEFPNDAPPNLQPA